MKVVIIGGGGLIGQKLARKLSERGTLRGQSISSMVLADMIEPRDVDAAFPVEKVTGNIANRDDLDVMIPADVDVIFHLAAVVSGHAEAEFDDGMAANLTGTLNVLERCRALPHAPVLVFTSSMAVYGGEVPDPILDWTLLNPQTSYGAQKAIGELLVNDYSRKGFVDGRGFRLPTISVRPGKPNRAASSFMSSIIREPLNGQEAVCPVGADYMHYYLSPRRCVENLIVGAEWDAEILGQNRCMQMPGKMLSIQDLIDAMTAVAGPEPAKLIKWEPQPEIIEIVKGWRYNIYPHKAISLGMTADANFEENVRYYMDDDLGKS